MLQGLDDQRARLVEEILDLGHAYFLWPGAELVKHLRRVLFKLPLDALERIATERPTFFAPGPDFSGRVFIKELEGVDLVVYLSPNLLSLPQDDIEGVIAHELAHVVRYYRDVDDKRSDGEMIAIAADEKAADGLAERWGFRVPRSLSCSTQTPP